MEFTSGKGPPRTGVYRGSLDHLGQMAQVYPADPMSGVCTMLEPIMGDLIDLKVPKSEGARHDIC